MNAMDDRYGRRQRRERRPSYLPRGKPQLKYLEGQDFAMIDESGIFVNGHVDHVELNKLFIYPIGEARTEGVPVTVCTFGARIVGDRESVLAVLSKPRGVIIPGSQENLREALEMQFLEEGNGNE